MKAQRLIHATKGQERVAKHANKLSGHGKLMTSRQIMDTHGSRARTRLKHNPLVPSQYRSGGLWVRCKRGYGLVVGRRGKPILGFPLKLFWGKCLTGMTYHPKDGKISWNH